MLSAAVVIGTIVHVRNDGVNSPWNEGGIEMFNPIF